MFGFVRTVYTTPGIIITTTTHNKKHKRFVFIRRAERRKEGNEFTQAIVACIRCSFVMHSIPSIYYVACSILPGVGIQ